MDDLQKHQLQELAQKRGAELTARRDELQKLTRAVAGNKAARTHAASLKELASYEPELATPEGRAELVNWAVSKGLGTRAECEAVTDITTIRRAHKQMKADKAAERRAETAKRTEAYGRKFHNVGPLGDAGIPFPKNSDEAMQRLKRRGTVDDALAVLHMRQMEKSND